MISLSPANRGMFTLSTVHPLPTSPLSSFIPPLNLNGRAVPREASVTLDQVDKPEGMTVWPDFHNGVAAGLCLAKSSSKVCTYLAMAFAVQFVKNYCCLEK